MYLSHLDIDISFINILMFIFTFMIMIKMLTILGKVSLLKLIFIVPYIYLLWSNVNHHSDTVYLRNKYLQFFLLNSFVYFFL
jgi:hypothetical protein